MENTITFHRVDSSDYDVAIRDLYQTSNAAMNVVQRFTDEALNGELRNPFISFARQPGCAIHVGVGNQNQNQLIAMVCVTSVPSVQEANALRLCSEETEETEETYIETKEISRFCVAQQFKRQGIASRLIRYVFQNHPQCEFILGCLGTNASAIRFYESIAQLSVWKRETKHSRQDGSQYEIIHFRASHTHQVHGCSLPQKAP